MTDDPRILVSTDWLAERLGSSGLVVLDASWHLPGSGRDPGAEFLAGHIPGARRFDLDERSDPESPLPHMAASPEAFEAWARSQGIDADAQVVAYDASGLFSAPRAWWVFRHMGHGRVAVLDGGLPKWRAEGRPVETGEPAAAHDGTFVARRDARLVRGADDVAAALRNGTATVIDARPAARFAGTAPEPRAGLRAGHMPGAINLPFPALLNADGTLKDANALEWTFAQAGLREGPVITTCGSGVTASILALALEVVGRPSAVYDGSWAEWGAGERPVEAGLPETTLGD